jgi:hypothetical protein
VQLPLRHLLLNQRPASALPPPSHSHTEKSHTEKRLSVSCVALVVGCCFALVVGR